MKAAVAPARVSAALLCSGVLLASALCSACASSEKDRGTGAAGGTASVATSAAGDNGRRFDQGIHLGFYGYDKPAWIEQGVSEIHGIGANAVAIMIGWVTPDIRSLTLTPTPDMTPTDDTLRDAIRRARGLGMRVFLMPFVYVERMATGEWRGTIEPPDWGLWFAGYEKFVLHYARISAEEGVDLFSVGSELCSAERHTEAWQSLIGRVRAIYPGRLTYSLNWDHLDAMEFGSSLDVLGMNAYFELSPKGGSPPAVEDLVAAWRPIVDRLSKWAESRGRNVVLTEVGYPSRAGAAADPWNYGVDENPAPREQANCYEAFHRVWGGEPWLDGVYFYRWWGEGGPEDTGYTPRGKPAAEVLSRWFRPERIGPTH